MCDIFAMCEPRKRKEIIEDRSPTTSIHQTIQDENWSQHYDDRIRKNEISATHKTRNASSKMNTNQQPYMNRVRGRGDIAARSTGSSSSKFYPNDDVIAKQPTSNFNGQKNRTESTNSTAREEMLIRDNRKSSNNEFPHALNNQKSHTFEQETPDSMSSSQYSLKRSPQDMQIESESHEKYPLHSKDDEQKITGPQKFISSFKSKEADDGCAYETSRNFQSNLKCTQHQQLDQRDQENFRDNRYINQDHSHDSPPHGGRYNVDVQNPAPLEVLPNSERQYYSQASSKPAVTMPIQIYSPLNCNMQIESESHIKYPLHSKDDEQKITGPQKSISSFKSKEADDGCANETSRNCQSAFKCTQHQQHDQENFWDNRYINQEHSHDSVKHKLRAARGDGYNVDVQNPATLEVLPTSEREFYSQAKIIEDRSPTTSIHQTIQDENWSQHYDDRIRKNEISATHKTRNASSKMNTNQQHYMNRVRGRGDIAARSTGSSSSKFYPNDDVIAKQPTSNFNGQKNRTESTNSTAREEMLIRDNRKSSNNEFPHALNNQKSHTFEQETPDSMSSSQYSLKRSPQVNKDSRDVMMPVQIYSPPNCNMQIESESHMKYPLHSKDDEQKITGPQKFISSLKSKEADDRCAYETSRDFQSDFKYSQHQQLDQRDQENFRDNRYVNQEHNLDSVTRKLRTLHGGRYNVDVKNPATLEVLPNSERQYYSQTSSKAAHGIKSSHAISRREEDVKTSHDVDIPHTQEYDDDLKFQELNSLATNISELNTQIENYADGIGHTRYYYLDDQVLKLMYRVDDVKLDRNSPHRKYKLELIKELDALDDLLKTKA